MRRLAFTLVELLIVILVVAVLASVAVQLFRSSSLEAKEAGLRRNLRLIRDAGARAEQDTGLTVKVSDLDNAVAPASGWRRGRMNTNWTVTPIPAGSWRGPYLDRIPVNPMTGNNDYDGGEVNTPGVAWTHYSNQGFNPEYFYYPSTQVGSNGRPYRTW